MFKKIINLLTVISISSLVFVTPAHAAEGGTQGISFQKLFSSCEGSTFADKAANLNIKCLGGMLQTIIDWSIPFAGTVALITIFVGALLYMTAAGNQKQMDTAKNTIVWAFIGLFVVLSAFAIEQYFVKIIS